MSLEEILPLMRHQEVWDAVVRWMTTGLLAMMALAIVVEYFRQKLRRRRQLATEWQSVAQIARDKGFTPSQWERLKGCIVEFAPEEPLRAATVRLDFDRCVARRMEALRSAGDRSAYEAAGVEFREVRVRLGLDCIPYGSRLLSTRELRTGQPISVSASDTVPREWVEGRVEAVDDAYFRVRFEGPPDRPLQPAVGRPIRCRFWRDDDARYMFTVPLAQVEADPPVWVLEHASDMDRVQTREFFRIHYEHTVMVRVLEPVPGDLSGGRTVAQLRARLTNLSAGGAALMVQQPVAAHLHLRIRLDLPGEKPVEVEARIIGTDPLGNERWVVRAGFINVDEETREELVRFVTLLQQQQMAAGLGSPKS